MKRMVHLIPYDGIGGVEIAAKSMPTGAIGIVHFERCYIVKKKGVVTGYGEHHGPLASENSPAAYFHTLVHLYRSAPDILLASLWRSALILIILKLLRPKTRYVLFLHSAHPFHSLDRIANKVAMWLSEEIWADSAVTLKKRVPRRLLTKGHVISFLLHSQSIPRLKRASPRFIFWGRLAEQKGLDRALGLFARIAENHQDAQFTIVGPDGGSEASLRKKVSELRLDRQVCFTGALPHDKIARCAKGYSFYLQTSRDEGMAMSVVEAMQAGLVPVVTPVGEISRYCQDGKNAMFVYDEDSAAERILALLREQERYQAMSRAAAEYWQNKALYRDDLIAAVERFLRR